MIQVDEKERIRRAYQIDGWSKRRIEAAWHHSRRTINQALADASEAVYHLRQPRTAPTMGAYQGVIDEWLLADRQRRPKQRHTAQRIYERLCEEQGFSGHESTVRRFVRLRRQALGGKTPDVFLPLTYDPGQDGQCDWGEAEVLLGGQLVTVQFLFVTLCYSQATFVMAFPHARQEAFFEGQVCAFEFWGGIPRRLSYDNLSSAVKHVLTGRRRQEQTAFIAFRSHHLFESRFCTVGQGHEKGIVEGQVGFGRRNWLVPLPEVADFAALNAHLRRKCLAYAEQHIQAGRTQTVGELWAAEKALLLPLPKMRYRCCTTTVATPNAYSLVRFDKNDYSVPTHYADTAVSVYGFVERVEMRVGNESIASHGRVYGEQQVVLDPLHYLTLLSQRPGAFEHAQPLRQWRQAWPAIYESYLAGLQTRYGAEEGVREFLQVLHLHGEHEGSVMEQALRRASDLEVYRAEGVRQLVYQLEHPTALLPPLSAEQTAHLPTVAIPAPDLSCFDLLWRAPAATRAGVLV